MNREVEEDREAYRMRKPSGSTEGWNEEVLFRKLEWGKITTNSRFEGCLEEAFAHGFRRT